MVIDVHCHIGFSARPVDVTVPRFDFERTGAASGSALDSYFSPRLLGRATWRIMRRYLGLGRGLRPGSEFDAVIDRFNRRHFRGAVGVDRLVLLAFDEYHDASGRAVGPPDRGQRFGSDLYVSNSLVRAECQIHPERFLFGGSLHPYRTDGRRDACAMLKELAAAGVALIKWLPIHQNIRADDPRTVVFLQTAARLRIPMLIHYGGEMTLTRQHPEFTSPAALLAVLRELKTNGTMPTVIIAHVATPSFITQNPCGHRSLVDALLGEFADDPLYADISALAAFGRTSWLRRLARHRELHRKLVWGSDYPVPVMAWALWPDLPADAWHHVVAAESWIERDLRLKRAIGFDESVFTRAASLLPATRNVPSAEC